MTLGSLIEASCSRKARVSCAGMPLTIDRFALHETHFVPGARVGPVERDIEWLVDHNGGSDRVIVVDHPDRAYVGKSLRALADQQKKSVPEVVVEMVIAGYADVPGEAYLRGYGIHEMDIDNYVRQDYTATSSDAMISGVPNTPFVTQPGSHPRHFGAFVRKISRYVKEHPVISLPFAIRSSTGLPAQIIGLRDRGLIREGYKADIVIFDFERLRDRATILEPALESEGVEYVLVNGRFAVDHGHGTNALAGVVVRRPRRES